MQDNDQPVLPVDQLSDRMDVEELETVWSNIRERIAHTPSRQTFRIPLGQRLNVWAAGLAGVAIVVGSLFAAWPHMHQVQSESQPAPSREVASAPDKWLAPSYIPPGVSHTAEVHLQARAQLTLTYLGPVNGGRELMVEELPNGTLPAELTSMTSTITLRGREAWLLDRSSHGGDTQIWFSNKGKLVMVRGLGIPLEQLRKTAESIIDAPLPVKDVSTQAVR